MPLNQIKPNLISTTANLTREIRFWLRKQVCHSEVCMNNVTHTKSLPFLKVIDKKIR